ncbi:MAG: hypothetical protein ABF453_02965 [Bifidobacterium psychraerophilum]|uniref:hypothetical protein n=1 Tax=Bifidobacterium psychraerophilum TaxID=218140 RepID=UPI0039EB52A4
MSIAVEESTQNFFLLEAPEHGDGLMERLLDAELENRSVIAQRNAYVAGRTAEPTEAEIEAAAKAMYENCATRWHASSSSGKWANAQVHKEYLIKARFALEAARKAVSVDE